MKLDIVILAKFNSVQYCLNPKIGSFGFSSLPTINNSTKLYSVYTIEQTSSKHQAGLMEPRPMAQM